MPLDTGPGTPIPGTPEDVIIVERSVSATRVAAFDRFVQGFAGWWPRAYTFYQDRLEHIALGDGVDAPCLERGGDGPEIVWGRMTLWQPPAALAFIWLIAPDRSIVDGAEKASLVRVDFEASFDAAGEEGTRVILRHGQLSRHGPGWQDYRAALASPQGWPWLMDIYAAQGG